MIDGIAERRGQRALNAINPTARRTETVDAGIVGRVIGRVMSRSRLVGLEVDKIEMDVSLWSRWTFPRHNRVHLRIGDGVAQIGFQPHESGSAGTIRLDLQTQMGCTSHLFNEFTGPVN